jgi:hypothetical protein
VAEHEKAIEQINADLTEIKEEIENMSALPSLDYSNPLHEFDSTHTTFTANKTCYLLGSIRSYNNEVSVSINNKRVYLAHGSNNGDSTKCGLDKLNAGDVVKVNGLDVNGAKCGLHIYEEL